jgi:hypothetical protein
MLAEKEIVKMSNTQRFLREGLAPLIKQEMAEGLTEPAREVTRLTLTEMLKDVSKQRAYLLDEEIELKIGKENHGRLMSLYTAEITALANLIDEFHNAKPNPKTLAGPHLQLINIPPILESAIKQIKKSARL